MEQSILGLVLILLLSGTAKAEPSCEDLIAGSENITFNLKQSLAVTLACSPSAKSKLAEGEISLAQMQQLGLIESPQVGFGIIFPVSASATNTAYEVRMTLNLMDLIQLPARKKLGQAEYERKKLEIAAEILQILTNTKTSYYQYQALLQLKSFWKSNLDAVQSMGDLSRAQRKAGNISALDEAQQLAFLKMAQLELMKVENQIKQARLEFILQIGLAGHDFRQEIGDKLPKLPEQLPNLQALIELAKIQRPQLLERKQKLQVGQRNIDLAKRNFFPRLNLGIVGEWDFAGATGVGPALQVGLPFLGHQSVALRKARAELKVSQLEFSTLEQNTPNDLEQVYQRLVLANQMVRFYRNDVLPLQERVLKESIKHYNYMLLGNYQLLLNKQNQIHVQKGSIEALRDYWIAYVELENLVGGSLGETL